MGENYDVVEITKALGVLPTETWINGTPIRNTGRCRSYTAWIYSTGVLETLNIYTQIEKLEALFIPKTNVLCGLKAKYDLDFSIDIVIVIENEEVPAIYLDTPIIQLAAKLEAKFDFDTYVN